jgi:elongation factor G
MHAFEAGIINRRGSIAERNTTGDYHELEQDRGNSIFTSSFTQNGGDIK